jgi:hypothetical protein
LRVGASHWSFQILANQLLTKFRESGSSIVSRSFATTADH